MSCWFGFPPHSHWAEFGRAEHARSFDERLDRDDLDTVRSFREGREGNKLTNNRHSSTVAQADTSLLPSV